MTDIDELELLCDAIFMILFDDTVRVMRTSEADDFLLFPPTEPDLDEDFLKSNIASCMLCEILVSGLGGRPLPPVNKPVRPSPLFVVNAFD